MNRCPITYQEIESDQIYSKKGLSLISPKLTGLNPLPYSAEEQRKESIKRAAKMSIQGMQPKLSARLNIPSNSFQIVDKGGRFILKPQQDYYEELPQNEDLTMKLAALAGIATPLHGLIRSSDGSLTYFIKRFDRYGRNKKRFQEDFAQLSGYTRDTKYDSSIEQVAATIERFCTFPAVEKLKLFKLVIFSYITGNEDMHLKNFSVIERDGSIILSPAYDLINTTLAMPHTKEEMALPLKGKKRNFTKNDLLKYFAGERLGLNDRVIDDELSLIKDIQPAWDKMIEMSFLSKAGKDKYREIVQLRLSKLF